MICCCMKSSMTKCLYETLPRRSQAALGADRLFNSHGNHLFGSSGSAMRPAGSLSCVSQERT